MRFVEKKHKVMKRDWAMFFWMLGVSIAHGLRFFVFDDPINRQIVAAGGIIIYGLSAILALSADKKPYQDMGQAVVIGWVPNRKAKAAYAISILFPLVGLATVLVTGAEVDNWQLAVGVTQFAAMPYAALRIILK